MSEREQKLLSVLEDLVDAVDNYHYNIPVELHPIQWSAAGAWLDDAWFRAKSIVALTTLDRLGKM